MNPGCVVAMGLITVFFGLIVLIVICELMGAICKRTVKAPEAAQAAPTPAPAAAPIANRQELVAAVSAAIAEEMGTDVSAIRILSLKKV